MSATVVAMQQPNERQEAVDLIRGVLGLYSDIYPGDERLKMSVDVLEALAENAINADGPVVAHALEVTLAAWNEAGMDYHLGGHPQYMTAAWVCGAIMYAFQPSLRLEDIQSAVRMAEFGAERHA